MAGDWIKIERATPDKPEVAVIAHRLKCEPDLVVGKLIRIWAWADENSVDGNGIPVTDAFLDRIAHRRGFAAAMRKAGWLTGQNECLSFPGFSRHNGSTAKGRAETNRRVAKHRKCNASVTLEPLQKPLPEKRREDKRDDKSSLSANGEFLEIPGVVQLYPKREKMAQAIEALAVHVKNGADIGSVADGTRAIAAVIARLPGGHLNAFVPSAEKFFRHRRWEDDPQTWLRNSGNHANGAPQTKLDLGGRRPASNSMIIE
jgi:hypothetical protein